MQTDPDQNSVPKNLKRKATDDNLQDATASCSHNQGAPPAKKQKIPSSEVVFFKLKLFKVFSERLFF